MICLLCTYKILSNKIDDTSGNCVTKQSYLSTQILFTQHVIKPWNNLNITLDDWSSVATFRSLIKKSDLVYLIFVCLL